jgi:aryl-alcohol dehydrogenase-like predicted oxidoreductase
VSTLTDARLSRRELIQTGIAGFGALLARPLYAATLPLITKKIPSSGEALPVMGIGTNAFRAPSAELTAVLKRMHELGGSVIDTAAMYGESEGVIGGALTELGIRNKMFIATKFNAEGAPMPGPPPGARPPGGPGGPPGGFRGPPPDPIYGQASLDRSLTRLKTDHVDLLQAHFLGSVEPLMPLMLQLKKAGKARYIGITTVMADQHPQLIEYMRKYPIDFVQVDYSLANREAASTVFPVAAERKIAVMVAVPLGGRMGSLLDQTQGRELPKWAADIDVSSWSQFFLKYVISHPAVTCAIPGSSKVEHLEDNQQAGHGRVPTAAQRKKMEEFWDNKA